MQSMSAANVNANQGMVYLLHFNQEIGSEKTRGKAQHYMGWSSDLESRLEAHSNGKSGAKIVCNGFVSKGIGFELARLWIGDRNLERRLKNRKKHRVFCPICQAEAEAK